VYIVLKWDEDLVLEILETRKSKIEKEMTEQENSEKQKKKAYCWDIVDGRHQSKNHRVVRIWCVGV